MTMVRRIDGNNDWTFGRGKNNYVTRNAAVVQTINCRLLSFLNDCFFDAGAGLDWWNLLGSKDQIALTLAVSAVILNTPEVIRLEPLDLRIDQNRMVTVQYRGTSIYSTFTGDFNFNASPS